MSLASRCRTGYERWKQPAPHPVTGDMLSPGERVTWKVMSVYRRWTVFLLLQLLTVVWLAFPGPFPGGRAGWNYTWSDLAIIVEMMVGIAFLNQSMRDARIIRAELADLGQLLEATRADAKLIRDIHEALCPGGSGAIVAVPGPDGTAALEIRDTP